MDFSLSSAKSVCVLFKTLGVKGTKFYSDYYGWTVPRIHLIYVIVYISRNVYHLSEPTHKVTIAYEEIY